MLKFNQTLTYITGPTRRVQYGHSWMRATVQARKAQDRTGRNPREELGQYLTAPLEDVDDVVGWWGVCNLRHMLSDTY